MSERLENCDDMINTDPLSEDEQRQLASLMAGREYILISHGSKPNTVFCNLGFTMAADKERAADTLLKASSSLMNVVNKEREK